MVDVALVTSSINDSTTINTGVDNSHATYAREAKEIDDSVDLGLQQPLERFIDFKARYRIAFPSRDLAALFKPESWKILKSLLMHRADGICARLVREGKAEHAILQETFDDLVHSTRFMTPFSRLVYSTDFETALTLTRRCSTQRINKPPPRKKNPEKVLARRPLWMPSDAIDAWARFNDVATRNNGENAPADTTLQQGREHQDLEEIQEKVVEEPQERGDAEGKKLGHCDPERIQEKALEETQKRGDPEGTKEAAQILLNIRELEQATAADNQSLYSISEGGANAQEIGSSMQATNCDHNPVSALQICAIDPILISATSPFEAIIEDSRCNDPKAAADPMLQSPTPVHLEASPPVQEQRFMESMVSYRKKRKRKLSEYTADSQKFITCPALSAMPVASTQDISSPASSVESIEVGRAVTTPLLASNLLDENYRTEYDSDPNLNSMTEDEDDDMPMTEGTACDTPSVRNISSLRTSSYHLQRTLKTAGYTQNHKPMLSPCLEQTEIGTPVLLDRWCIADSVTTPGSNYDISLHLHEQDSSMFADNEATLQTEAPSLLLQDESMKHASEDNSKLQLMDLDLPLGFVSKREGLSKSPLHPIPAQIELSAQISSVSDLSQSFDGTLDLDPNVRKPHHSNHMSAFQVGKPATISYSSSAEAAVASKSNCVKSQDSHVQSPKAGLQANQKGDPKPVVDLTSISSSPMREDNGRPIIEFKSILGQSWLNDSVIQRALELFSDGISNCKVISSHCVTFEGNDVKINTLPPILEPIQFLTVPLHQGCHWTLAWIDLHRGVMQYYDSWKGNECFVPAEKALRVLGTVLSQKLETCCSHEKWQIQAMYCAKQSNSYDCGIHTIVNAVHCMRAIPKPSKVDASLWRNMIGALLREGPLEPPVCLRKSLCVQGFRDSQNLLATNESWPLSLLDQYEDSKDKLLEEIGHTRIAINSCNDDISYLRQILNVSLAYAQNELNICEENTSSELTDLATARQMSTDYYSKKKHRSLLMETALAAEISSGEKRTKDSTAHQDRAKAAFLAWKAADNYCKVHGIDAQVRLEEIRALITEIQQHSEADEERSLRLRKAEAERLIEAQEEARRQKRRKRFKELCP